MEVAKLIYGTMEITHGSTLEMATVIWAATHNQQRWREIQQPSPDLLATYA